MFNRKNELAKLYCKPVLFVGFLLILSMLVMLMGCSGEKKSSNSSTESKKTAEKPRINKKAANTVLENYMRFLMQQNNGAMKAFYSAGLKKKVKHIAGNAGVQPIGYTIGEGELSNDKATFKINIYNLGSKQLYFSDDSFKYELKLEGRNTVIDNIIKEKSTELYAGLGADAKTLFKREGDQLQGAKVVSLNELPAYVTAKEATAPEQKYKMPDSRFGPCALSPDGKLIVFSTTGENSFVGILKEDSEAEAYLQKDRSTSTLGQDQMVFAADNKQKGGGQQGQGQSQQSQQQGQGGTQQQSGKNYKITTVDLFFSCEVKKISFSPDGKLFVVEYAKATKKNGGAATSTSKAQDAVPVFLSALTTTKTMSVTPTPALGIVVYDSQTGERKELKSSKQFNLSRLSMTDAYFSKPEELVFKLIPAPVASAAERGLKGYWRLNLQSGLAKQF